MNVVPLSNQTTIPQWAVKARLVLAQTGDDIELPVINISADSIEAALLILRTRFKPWQKLELRLEIISIEYGPLSETMSVSAKRDVTDFIARHFWHQISKGVAP